MSNLDRRWLDSSEISPELRAVLQSSEEDLAPGQVKKLEARLVAILGPTSLLPGGPLVGGGAGKGGAVAAGTSTQLTGGAAGVGVAKKILLAVGVLTTSSVAVWKTLPTHPGANHREKVQETRKTVSRSRPPSPQEPQTELPIFQPLIVEPRSSVARAPRRHSSKVSESIDPDVLGNEVRLLELARQSLRENPNRALAIASEHARLYAHGTLIQEREVVAIEALARLGRRSEAGRRGARFLERHRNSAYAPKIRDILNADLQAP